MTDRTTELIDNYAEIDSKIKELDAQKKELRNQIAQLMHEYKTNQLILTDSSGKKWKCYYQTKTSKSPNYQLLMEYVGPQNYHEVVSEKSSTSLVVTPAPKKEQEEEDKTREKPVEDSVPNAPKGVIS